MTTDMIKSKKLREQYGIEYVRMYEHLPTGFATLFIKFINGEILKARVPSFSQKFIRGSIDVKKTKGRRKKRKKV